MMTDIYYFASCVLIWLGTAPIVGMATLAIGLLHEVGNQPPNIDLYAKYEKQRLDLRWQALIRFLNYPWFTIVRIVQEVAVASKVLLIHGGLSFDWDFLASGIETFMDAEMSALPQMTQLGRSTVGNINNFSSIATIRSRYPIASIYRKSLRTFKFAKAIPEALRTKEDKKGRERSKAVSERISKSLSLTFLLTKCGRFDSTDPKDKIFAFTGLATDDPNPVFTPNYTKSVYDVYCDVAFYIFLERTPFSVISCAGIGSGRKLGDLPSWGLTGPAFHNVHRSPVLGTGMN